MSLLNDALRKKRSERQASGEKLPSGLMKCVAKSKRNRSRTVVLCILAMLVTAGAAFWYGAAFENTPRLAVVGPPADLSEAHADNPAVRQPSGNPIMPPVSGPSAQPAVIAPAGDKPQRDDPRSDKQPEINSAQIPRHSPAIAMESPKTQAVANPTAELPGHVSRQPTARKSNDADLSAMDAGSSGTAEGLGVQRLFEKGRQYHRRDRLDQAIALYQEVLRVDPAHDKARSNLIAAYLQTEAYTKAYPMAAELYMREPNNLQVMLNLAIAHIGCGRFREAIGLLDKAAGQPDAPLFEIALHKAVAYRQLNQLQDALTWYKRAEALRPDDPGLLFNLAVAYDQQRQYEAAIDYYLRYIERDGQGDALKTKKIRRRVRVLQAYQAQAKF